MKNSPIPSMLDIELTEHFTIGEMLKSDTAQKQNIPNIPTFLDLVRLRNLCFYLLEPLRNLYGKPIYVTSGYRSLALNLALKGAKKSQHMKGEAADIKGENRAENMKLALLIKENLHFDQLILEKCDANGWPAWVHVSYKSIGENRHQILRT